MTDNLTKFGNRFVVAGQEVDPQLVRVELTSDDLTEYRIPLEASPAAVYAWKVAATARELEFLFGTGSGPPYGLLGKRWDQSRDFLADMVRIRAEERFARAQVSPVAINVGVWP